MVSRIIDKVIGSIIKTKKQKDNCLKYVFRKLKRDPLSFAYNNIGILHYQNSQVSGEDYLLSEILPRYIKAGEEAILFDVGANIGGYTSNLASIYTHARIFSLEPNNETFKILKKNVQHLKSVCPVNVGLSFTKKKAEIYTYSKESDSQHASLYKDVFHHLHNTDNIMSISIELDSLDDFCYRKNIETIDFIKIDTEGHEYEVLKGGVNMINAGRIKIIQFEFNEMNVISRIFLKDFYKLLKDYKIYRMSEKELIPLFSYNSTNEIFKFQNFLAIHKSL